MTDRSHLVVETRIEPKSAADAERLLPSLEKMASGDITFGYVKDTESGETLILGIDEPSLDAHLATLKEFHGISVLCGPPQVRYRETLAQSVDVDHTHKKQAGSTGQFARVGLRLERNKPGEGNKFSSEIIGDTVPREYVPSVQKGVQSVWDSGVLIGFPMVDMKVTLFDGAFHKVDSSTAAFEIAARQAMLEGCRQAGVKLLEPIMNVEVIAPRGFIGAVIGDISARRGRVLNQQPSGNDQAITADVPLAELFRYQHHLHSIADGLAKCTLGFSHYAEVPRRGDGPDDFPPAVGARA